MQKTKLMVISFLVVLFIGFYAFSVSSQETIAKADDVSATVPAEVTVNFIQNLKSPVTFPHKDHVPRVAGKCGNCHVNANGGGVLKPEFLKKPANLAEGLKNPFHGQCLDCHKASGSEKAPKTCNQCHK